MMDKSMNSTKSPSKKTLFTKKKVLLIIGAAVVIILALYAWLSISYWNAYADDLKSTKLASSQVSKKITTGSSLDEIISSSKDLKEDSDKISDCQPKWYYSWQTIFSGPKKQLADCRDLVGNLSQAQSPLDDLINFEDYQQKLANIVSSLPDGQLKATDLAGHQKALQGLEKELESLAKNSDYPEISKAAADTLKGYGTSIAGLIEADKKKDMAGFEKSAGDLSNAHKKLQALNAEESKTYTKLFDTLLKKLKPLS